MPTIGIMKDNGPISMTKSRITSILAVFILFMVSLEDPLFYFYLGGLIGMVAVGVYILVGLVLTIVLIFRVITVSPSARTRFQIVACIIIPCVGVASIFGETLIEKIDWYLRQSTRNTYVNIAKRSDHHPVGTHHLIHANNFPPISNGGNDITVDYGMSKSITVTFYINRGFLDHYSAFVYSDDSVTIKELEGRVTEQPKPGNEKLDIHWYKVNY